MAIVLENISKTFGTVTAVHEVSFTVGDGEMFGLIGPDGAGKTTLFRLMTTLLVPDMGFCTVNGLDTVKDYAQIRRLIGYMPGKFSLYGDMSVAENLQFFASLFGVTPEQNRHLIDDIYSQIEPFKNRRAAKLSGGMKQKLALCCALVHAPKILFLDEPTTGIDPVSRKELWEMLARLKQQGITIIASTPYMDEAKRCERIAFLQSGKVLTIQSPDEIVKANTEPLFAVTADNMHSLLNDVRSFEGVERCYSYGDCHHFTLRRNAVDTIVDTYGHTYLYRYLQSLGHTNITIRQIAPSIEDCYIKLSQH